MERGKSSGAVFTRPGAWIGLMVVVAALAIGCASMERQRDAIFQRSAVTQAAPDAAAAGGFPAASRKSADVGMDMAFTTTDQAASTAESSRQSGAVSTSVPGGGERERLPEPVDLKAKRLVIYTANFSILVANVEESIKDLLARIDGWNGFVQTSDMSKVTFRVPAANFDQAAEEVSQMGIVTNKQINAQDVTSQFRDLELRLEVAETSRKRMMAILEKAAKTQDIIEIEKEIRRLTEEIEAMKAQIRSMADQIAYSTITVNFQAKAPAPVAQPRPRRQVSYFDWINQIGSEHVINEFAR